MHDIQHDMDEHPSGDATQISSILMFCVFWVDSE